MSRSPYGRALYDDRRLPRLAVSATPTSASACSPGIDPLGRRDARAYNAFPLLEQEERFRHADSQVMGRRGGWACCHGRWNGRSRRGLADVSTRQRAHGPFGGEDRCPTPDATVGAPGPRAAACGLVRPGQGRRLSRVRLVTLDPRIRPLVRRQHRGPARLCSLQHGKRRLLPHRRRRRQRAVVFRDRWAGPHRPHRRRRQGLLRL